MQFQGLRVGRMTPALRAPFAGFLMAGSTVDKV